MSTKDASMESALLEIAKDLLQASDDLAATDPSASAKLAQEAYEIGRDLGIVRNHLDDDDVPTDIATALQASSESDSVVMSNGADVLDVEGARSQTVPHRRNVDEEPDADLFRILDRQKAMLPKPVELAPVRKPSRSTKTMTFESTPKRSGWFGWMLPREWRHAG